MGNKQPRRRKHVPQRTCVGCRSVLSKRELVRVVRTPEGVFVDRTGRLNGRGAYLHNRRSCWDRALKGSLSKALKTDLTTQDLARLKDYYGELPVIEEEGTEYER